MEDDHFFLLDGKECKKDRIHQEKATLNVRRNTETVITLGKLSTAISYSGQQNDDERVEKSL